MAQFSVQGGGKGGNGTSPALTEVVDRPRASREIASTFFITGTPFVSD